MYPILFEMGPIVIRSYGALVALGFLAGIVLAVKRAKKKGINEDVVLDLSLYALIAGILGARIFEVLVNIQDYMQDPVSVFKIWEGGLTYYGGFLGAGLVIILYLRAKKLEFWKIADLMAPSLALGHAIGRLGCFTAGCCYGSVTDLPWGVTFSHPLSLAPLGLTLHPTQLYSSLGNLVIFGVLLLIDRKKKFSGQVFWTYGIMYSVFRFFVEFLRADPRGFVPFGILSISQVVSGVLFIASIIMLLKLRRHK
ncbi:MAG: prolipoprotein diacylglyceryl transferase [bacterium]